MRGIEVSRLRAVHALAVPVLETGMEEAVMLAESMDARGHGRGRRTRYRPELWGPRSSVVALASAVAATLFVARAVAGDTTLIAATTPLEWPRVSGLLTAGALLFALPALLGAGRR